MTAAPPLWRRVCAAALLLAPVACATGGSDAAQTPAAPAASAGMARLPLLGATVSSDAVQIPVVPVASARVAPSPLPGALSLPSRRGPSPAVIVLHGCAGLGSGAQVAQWMNRLAGWGYAVLIVDSLTPRGISTVCAPSNQWKVTFADRSADVIAAALFLRGQPRIDPARIAVIGFSHGGGTVVTYARTVFQSPYPGLVKAAVNYYGPCREPTLYGGLPILALAGETDDWGRPAKTCRDYAAALHDTGTFEVHTYPDTYHAFDNARLMARSTSEGHIMQYNPTAAADSYDRVRAFLERYVGRPSTP